MVCFSCIFYFVIVFSSAVTVSTLMEYSTAIKQNGKYKALSVTSYTTMNSL